MIIPPYDTPQYKLFFHAEDGALAALQQLIADGGLDINGKDDYGWTALSLAARSGHTECVRCLLENGAAPSLPNDDDGWTPLMFAAYSDDRDAMDLLIKKGANIHAKDTEDGRTALMWCALWGFRDGIETLMNAGARTDDKDKRGQTAADLAESRKHPELFCGLESHAERKSRQCQNFRRYLKNKHLKR
jgi:ankyrin repeat protein